MPNLNIKKAYVIVEIGWEYNDEYYSKPEGGGSGIPKLIYLDEASANQVCEDLNKKFREENALNAEKHKWGGMRYDYNNLIEEKYEVVPVEVGQ